jgi:hypothetical protein
MSRYIFAFLYLFYFFGAEKVNRPAPGAAISPSGHVFALRIIEMYEKAGLNGYKNNTRYN